MRGETGMKTITLDIRDICEADSLHGYLRARLGFNEYYGCNLDALYDELTSICEDTHIHLIYSKKNKDAAYIHYLQRVLGVFQDAENENPGLSFAKEQIEKTSTE